MSLAIAFATAGRVLRQLLHDPRTIALMLLVPSVLLGLLAWIFDATPQTFDQVGPAMLAVFPFVAMFLVTSVATLRERTSGTLERLLAMPMHKLDLLSGYAFAFGLAATLQAALASALAVTWYGLDLVGPLWLLLVVAVLDAVLGMALGLLVSAFASTEFQAVQFMPAFVLPQFLLCGLIVPRDQLPEALNVVSDLLPLSYAVDAMQHLTTSDAITSDLVVNMGIVAGAGVAALALGAATLRRRTA